MTLQVSHSADGLACVGRDVPLVSSDLPAVGDTQAATPGPNLSAVSKSVQGDGRLLRCAVDLILEDCRRRINDIETSIADRDLPAVRRAAHTIECSLQVFGAHRGRNLALSLQALERLDGQDPIRLLVDLKREFNRIQPILDRLMDGLHPERRCVDR